MTVEPRVRVHSWPDTLPISVLGLDENGGNLYGVAVWKLHQDDAIRTNLLAEPSLPRGPLQGLYVSPLRVVLLVEFVNGTFYPFLNVAWKLE
jgi:hypothetical protein